MKKPIYSPFFFRKNMMFSILAVVLCALLLVGAFGFFVYNSNIKTLDRATAEASRKSLMQTENALDSATRVCMFFAAYKTISPVFQSQQTTLDLQKATLREEMRTFIACNDYLVNITVVTDSYTLSHGNETATQFSQPTKYKAFDISYSMDNNWTGILRISFSANESDFYNVTVDIYTSYIGKLYFDEDTYCYSPDGRLIFASDPSLLGMQIEDVTGISLEDLQSGHARGFTLSTHPLDVTGYVIATVQDNSTVLPQILLNTLSYLSVCILMFTIIIPIIYLQLKRIYRPINKVIDMFKYYLPQNDTYIEDDIKFISNCVSDPDMSEVTQSAILQIRKSQLYTLQSQISPHFLGNSLDIISWKAVDVMGIDNPISESLNVLSLFLSNSYEYSSMFLTIREEIGKTNEYIKLAKSCFIKNLTLNWQVDNDLLQYSIISLTLQPLIENSIVHGFRYPESRERATINISILRQGNDIDITLEDNGSGMSEDTLKELRIALFDEEISKHHIGLKNCHLKLKLLYGPKYGITRIDSSPSGTCIKLLIPQYVYPYANVSQEEE